MCGREFRQPDSGKQRRSTNFELQSLTAAVDRAEACDSRRPLAACWP